MDLLNNNSQTKVTNRAIGSFVFDCVTTEAHESKLQLTENPVESGAAIADHAILEPKEITISGVMVSYEPPKYAQKSIGLDYSNLDDYPLPLSVTATAHQAESIAARIKVSYDQAQTQVSRVLAPWYPEGLGMSTDSSTTLDRVGKAYEELLSLQKKGETVDVQTGLKRYKNMMIVSISTAQKYDGSAEFNISLREIFIVSTQLASGIQVTEVSGPKTGASSADKKSVSSRSSKNMGRTQPPRAKKSVLAGIKGEGRKILGGLF